MADTCVQSITGILSTMLVIVINCLRLFVVVINCCHGDGSDGRHVCTNVYTYYQATMVIVINCLRLSAVVIYCCHGDGSDGKRVCSKYISRPYALLSGYYVGYSD